MNKNYRNWEPFESSESFCSALIREGSWTTGIEEISSLSREINKCRDVDDSHIILKRFWYQYYRNRLQTSVREPNEMIGLINVFRSTPISKFYDQSTIWSMLFDSQFQLFISCLDVVLVYRLQCTMNVYAQCNSRSGGGYRYRVPYWNKKYWKKWKIQIGSVQHCTSYVLYLDLGFCGYIFFSMYIPVFSFGYCTVCSLLIVSFTHERASDRSPGDMKITNIHT